MEKTCFKCSRTLAIAEFYKHPQMSDGHLNKCKFCTRLDAHQRREKMLNDPSWVEMEANRQRVKNRESNKLHPEIHRARRAVRSLGRSSDFHLHHWSYLPEHKLDVFKLTPEDHRKAHRHMVYDQEQFQYRRASTMVLLDSRAAHEQFLRELDITPF